LPVGKKGKRGGYRQKRTSSTLLDVTIAPFADTVTVHLRSLPVPLAAKARASSEDLLREFALLTADLIESRTATSRDQVPAKLLELVVGLTQQLAELHEEASLRFEGALAEGSPVIADHVFEYPAELAAVTRKLADLFDEADQYCWTQDHLMPVSTPPDCAAYRRWVFAQVLDQLDGRSPVAWPDSAAARGL
jgi:hypothetical protein